MALKLEQKQTIVTEVNEVAGVALSAVVADYRGMTVAEMRDLRAHARDTGVYLKVVRNTLARRAVDGTECECLKDVFVGPTMLAFSTDEPGAAARLLKKYTAEYSALEVKALCIGGELLDADELNRVATLPTLDEARALLLRVMIAPATKAVRTFNEVPGTLVRVLAGVRDQKQKDVD